MFDPREDDDKESLKDQILEHLSGEVDDYTGSTLPDEEGAEKGSSPDGVEISIIVRPKGGAKEKGAEGEEPEEDGEHDEIAHALGMCEGGCTYSK